MSARRTITEPEWLTRLRDAALERFEQLGLPEDRDEEWRYTPLDEVRERVSAASGGPIAAPDPGELRALLPDCPFPRFVLVDGVPDESLSDPALFAGRPIAGLTLGGLRTQDALLREQARRQLAAEGPLPQAGLLALNTVLLRDALVLRTAPDVAVATPVVITLIAAGGPAPAQSRLLLELAPGSRLDLVIHHIGRGPGLTNAVTQVQLGRGARLRLARLQESAADALLVESTHVDLATDATADVATVDLGGRLSRHDLNLALRGSGASAGVHGLFLARGTAHVDNHTRTDHCVPRTTSREDFRGVVDGSARAVFNGRIIVHPGAAGTDAALTNRNLLLTRTAEIDTKPELEIYTDDVRCSHGATTGQLDERALFYLRSRGIALAEARSMLVTAFVREVLEGIAVPRVREYLEPRLGDALAQLEVHR